MARVGHGLRRLVVVGSTGFVSLGALRWLADQNASFVMLDRDGKVLLTTGPVRSSDVRLRRAQAIAQTNGVDVDVSRYLIDEKLQGQELVVRNKLQASSVANAIGRWRLELAEAMTINDVRLVESQAASLYWSAFHDLPVRFPQQQVSRVPQHWLTFGTRQSPISKSCRLAVNPSNAMLNYLYAIVESECRLAAATLGLDPGMGFLHLDTVARDSLACDLMEPIRPRVDSYLIDFLGRHLLSREWFFELGNGNCRLMPEIISSLTETSTQWAKHIAPVAEWVARALWTSAKRKANTSEQTPPTRLTGAKKYQVKGAVPPVPSAPVSRVERVCEKCGKAPSRRGRHCLECARSTWRDEMNRINHKGRILANSPEANAKRVEKQANQWAARRAWKPEMQPAWLTAKVYCAEIQPRLVTITVPEIADALSISEAYAADIRSGRHNPHPRHWQVLAHVVGVSGESQVFAIS